MKKPTRLLFLLLLIPFMTVAQDPAGAAAATNIRGAKYPLVLPDHRVTFRIKAPNAQQVQIDLGKKYDLLKGRDDYWTVTTEPLGPGFHYYSLLIDGFVTADPASESFYGMGRMTSGIEIPFSEGSYYAVKDVPHGDIRVKKYYSATTRSWRQVYIYTPPGYDGDQHAVYPVLYLLHGGGEDERGWSAQGKADMILDNLIAEGKAKPMLLVMPDANLGPGGFGEEGLKTFENEMTQCIIPLIEKNYRVKNSAYGRALAGLSMGGLNTLYTGLGHTDLFSYLGVFSSGWILPTQNAIADAQYGYLKQNSGKVNKALKLFWLSEGGKEDIAYKNGQVLLGKLDELNIRHVYYEYPGGHTWPVWRDALFHFAPLLFK